MNNIGMILIIVGWAIQLTSKGKEMKRNFVLIYAVGVLLLVIDEYRNHLVPLGTLNLISFSLAMAVFLKIRK
ncbi:MAG: hypothetical protein WC831_02540 [Parcubacteria group bacterium]|jgi:hypothetical protein